jgi:hypothetical protein
MAMTLPNVLKTASRQKVEILPRIAQLQADSSNVA